MNKWPLGWLVSQQLLILHLSRANVTAAICRIPLKADVSTRSSLCAIFQNYKDHLQVSTYSLHVPQCKKNTQVRLCSGCAPRSHPTPESTSASFSDWPTFTHTWLITDLGSDKDFLSFPWRGGNKFDYLVFCCSYFHRHPFPEHVTVFLFHCCDNQLWTATKRWYGLIACGLRGRFVVQFTATERPIKVQEVAQGLPSLTWENTQCYGVHDGRLQEIRSAIAGMQGSGSPLSSITNCSLLNVSGDLLPYSRTDTVFTSAITVLRNGSVFLSVDQQAFLNWVFLTFGANIHAHGVINCACFEPLLSSRSIFSHIVQKYFNIQRMNWHKKMAETLI